MTYVFELATPRKSVRLKDLKQDYILDEVSRYNPLKSEEYGLGERRVTIGAGFICYDGIVLCADTEETAGYIKTRADKLLTFQDDGCAVGIVGAGKSALVDMAGERLFDALNVFQGETLYGVRKVIEDTLLGLYQNHFAAFPTDDPADRIIDLLIAVKPKVGHRALFHAVGPVVRTIHTYSVIGTGSLVRYLADGLYGGSMPMKSAITLCIHLLSVAKQYISGCGGESHVIVVKDSGKITYVQLEDAMLKADILRRFQIIVRELMFTCVGTTTPNEEFQKHLDTLVKYLSRLGGGRCFGKH